MGANRRFSDENTVIIVDFDPNQSDTLTNVSSTRWVNMERWNKITCIAIRTVGTGKVQNAGIYVSAAAAGTAASLVGSLIGSTNATGSLVGADPATAFGSQDAGIVVLEATHDEIAVALEGGQYVSARMSLATGTDEFGVIYILSEPRFAAGSQMSTSNAAS